MVLDGAKDRYLAGEDANVRFVLQNTGAESVTLRGYEFRHFVSRLDTCAWRQIAAQTVSGPMVSPRVMLPGDAWVYHEGSLIPVPPQVRLPPGTYLIGVSYETIPPAAGFAKVLVE